MYINQQLSILFYLKRKKTTSDGMIPIYVRVTIDGLEDERSFRQKVFPAFWVNETKTVTDGHPGHQQINKQLKNGSTDLSRIFDMLKGSHELVTPTQVLEAYFAPANDCYSLLKFFTGLARAALID
ncbi:MAG TPA: Arm DNA-binding domain-containing protein [Puia sp.]|nr:Arm DNA-binding domain-containing protein [Puia sp.]